MKIRSETATTLGLLADHCGWIEPKALAEVSGKTRFNAVKRLHSLEEAGFVRSRKTTTHPRSREYILTSQGKEELDRYFAARAEKDKATTKNTVTPRISHTPNSVFALASFL